MEGSIQSHLREFLSSPQDPKQERLNPSWTSTHHRDPWWTKTCCWMIRMILLVGWLECVLTPRNLDNAASYYQCRLRTTTRGSIKATTEDSGFKSRKLWENLLTMIFFLNLTTKNPLLLELRGPNLDFKVSWRVVCRQPLISWRNRSKCRNFMAGL